MSAKRGPQGLAKSAKKKKVANNEEDVAGEVEETIALPKDLDPEDELGQLYALYSTYLQSTKENPKLLYAIVHESDRLLRNATSELPAKFHKVYADSLAMLSVFAKKKKLKSASNDTPEDFLLASVERADIGLAKYPKSVDLMVVRCESRLAIVEMKLKHSAKSRNVESCVTTIQLAVKDFDDALKLRQEHDDPDTESSLEGLQKVLKRISKLLETTLESDFIAERFPDLYSWVEQKWKNELAKDPQNRALHRGLGEFLLARAYPYLAIVESKYDREYDDGDDDESEEESAAASQQAKQFLTDSLEHLYAAETEDDGVFLSIVAEAQVSLANLETEEMQDKLYAEATDRLTRAHAMGAGDFSEMIAELKSMD